MKHFAKRTIALVLCLLAVCALFPLPADAYSDAYTTVGYTKEKDKETGKEVEEYHMLRLPYKGCYYSAKDKLPKRAKIKSNWKNGCIYFMPQPEVGHGTLGVVDTGTPVTILAEQNGLYFFMTDDGRLGWNGKGFFTKPKAISKDQSKNLSGGSALTGETIQAVTKFLTKTKHSGGSTTTFYADRSILILESGDTARVTIHGISSKGKYKFSRTDGDSAEAKWVGKKFVNYKRDVEFTANEPGMTTFKFTNKATRQTFSILVIVV